MTEPDWKGMYRAAVIEKEAIFARQEDAIRELQFKLDTIQKQYEGIKRYAANTIPALESRLRTFQKALEDIARGDCFGAYSAKQCADLAYEALTGATVVDRQEPTPATASCSMHMAEDEALDERAEDPQPARIVPMRCPYCQDQLDDPERFAAHVAAHQPAAVERQDQC